MKIETKFNFGQRVYAIIQGNEEYKETCGFCEGKGILVFKDVAIGCPATGCNNGYITKSKKAGWYIPKGADTYGWSEFVVQKIGVEKYNPNNKRVSDNRSWIYYMSDSSGTMWNEDNLFTSISEAQKECDIRNNIINL